ncbi:MAG TPA: SDR family oxidoreductase [Burkholderiales bacterium]|jgi:NAD(P)-dependent dehydrogenase (short-subunit alcohol dehydrogenase family)|nr:SDR family oxidoreductase [Burkholderiales bacterium]
MRTVVITGASGNLGKAVAQAFARDKLVPLDVKSGVNLLDMESIRAALKSVERVDVLCNIAGGFRMGTPVHETSDKDWSFLMDLNARTVINMSRVVVPLMLKAGGGKIVNIGAFAAQKGAAQMGAYIASKSAVIRLTETMAAELREKNINVNCVLPTIIDTPENRAAMPDADPRKWVAPEALADVIAFLCSDAARAVHGAALPVTGLS